MSADSAPIGPRSQKKTTQPRADKTRLALVEAARQVLHDDGPGGLTVGRVVSLAGRAQGTFYVHYDSKEALLTELITATWNRLEAISREAWEFDRPLTSIRSTIDRYLGEYERDSNVWLMLDELASRDVTFAQLRIDILKRFVGKVVAGLEGVRATTNVESPHSLQLTAEVLVGALEATARRAYRDKAINADRKDLVDELVRIWQAALTLNEGR